VKEHRGNDLRYHKKNLVNRIPAGIIPSSEEKNSVGLQPDKHPLTASRTQKCFREEQEENSFDRKLPAADVRLGNPDQAGR
jgi:hypothetical protein